jgi:hypothetical protein
MGTGVQNHPAGAREDRKAIRSWNRYIYSPSNAAAAGAPGDLSTLLRAFMIQSNIVSMAETIAWSKRELISHFIALNSSTA